MYYRKNKKSVEEKKFYKTIKLLVDLFKSDGRVLKIRGDSGLCIVLSDLHNDGDTLNYILDTYFNNLKDSKIIICGDHVDRSPTSWLLTPTATLDSLFKLKLKYPDRIFLLIGNHELNPSKYRNFMPCEFWYSLSEYDETFYTQILEALPVVAVTDNGVIMTHGALPTSPAFLKDLDLNSPALMDFLWGEYKEEVPQKKDTARPKRGPIDFRESMAAFGGNVLIKGHDPYAPLVMFENRCITLNASCVYGKICGRHIAIVDLGKPAKSADDITLVNLGKRS